MPLDTKHTTWPKVCGQLDEVRALQDSQVPSLPSFKSEKRSSSTTTSEDDTVNIPLFHQSDSLCVYKLLQIKYQSLQTTNSCYNSSCDINLIRGEMTFFFYWICRALWKHFLWWRSNKLCVCVCVYIHMQILKMRLKWVKLDSCDSAFSWSATSNQIKPSLKSFCEFDVCQRAETLQI